MNKNPNFKLLAIVFIATSTGTILTGHAPGSTSIPTEDRDAKVALTHIDFDRYQPPRLARIAPSSRSVKQNTHTQAIATLVNGNYQFCTELPPSDWRTGAGVCFNFAKIGDRLSGYYGYPYTDDFICVRGKVKGKLVTGEALMISWLGREWTSIPKTAFNWDEEGRLTLKDGNIIRTTIDTSGRTDWILFRSAILDTGGFYRYDKLPLTSPSQLCKWT